LFQIAAPATPAKPLNRKKEVLNSIKLKNLRCRDGDLAIVINEVPECLSNIGKLVQIKGPPKELITSNAIGWQITPVERRRWCLPKQGGKTVRKIVNWRSDVYLADSYLLPVRPGGQGTAISTNLEGIRGNVNNLPQLAAAGELVATKCLFDFSQLAPGTRFFDWEDMPITTPEDIRTATAWCPQPQPRNPSDVRNKAGEISAQTFADLYFLKAYPWANWPSLFIRQLEPRE